MATRRLVGVVVYFVATFGIERFNPTVATADKPAFVIANLLYGDVAGVANAQLRMRAGAS